MKVSDPCRYDMIISYLNSAILGSSTATPITSLLALMLLWVGVSAPLVFVGSYFGFKAETISVPVRTNQINRWATG